MLSAASKISRLYHAERGGFKGRESFSRRPFAAFSIAAASRRKRIKRHNEQWFDDQPGVVFIKAPNQASPDRDELRVFGMKGTPVGQANSERIKGLPPKCRTKSIEIHCQSSSVTFISYRRRRFKTRTRPARGWMTTWRRTIALGSGIRKNSDAN